MKENENQFNSKLNAFIHFEFTFQFELMIRRIFEMVMSLYLKCFFLNKKAVSTNKNQKYDT